jgi:ATP-dependent Lhr-like helicase
MLKHEFLFEAGGLLSMGAAAERAYGQKEFMELYAVFSSPVLYRVVTEGAAIWAPWSKTSSIASSSR